MGDLGPESCRFPERWRRGRIRRHAAASVRNHSRDAGTAVESHLGEGAVRHSAPVAAKRSRTGGTTWW